MAFPPNAILYVNKDISPSVIFHLKRQLFLTDVIEDGYVFDANVSSDPNYLQSLRATNQRVMVLRDDFATRGTNPYWTSADVVMFVKQGIAAIECNKFGSPIFNTRALTISWGALGVF